MSRSRRTHAARRTAAVVALALLASVLGTTSASAVGQPQNAVVNVVPSTATPYLTNGAVKAIAQVGSRIVLGGTFTGARNPGSTAVVTRNYVLAFDATTGVIDPGFVPAVNGEVDAVTASADGNSVYLGGKFTTVNGVASKSVARVNIANGTAVAGFKTLAFTGVVNDLRLVGNRLYLGGTFTKIGPVAHVGLATINATTGATDPFVSLQMAGHHNYPARGNTSAGVGVNKFDITPDGRRLMAIGNFTSVSGQSRDQIVSVSLTGTSATVDTGWNSSTYTPACYSWAYDSYMRAIQFSPDGSYFVVVTTGGYYGGSFEACDATARFETAAAGADVKPTWVDYTGTDSLYSVAVTGTAIYVGGHQRWLNNPYGQDSPGPGAVPRPGLAALDPVTGTPLSWNPGRNPRGHGAEVLLATSAGLYVGSDTTWIGNYKYSRGRLAFFPLAGGRTLAPANTGTLPGNVYLAGRSSNTNTNVVYRVNAAGPAQQAVDGGPDWAADTDATPSPYHNSGTLTSSSGPVANVAATVPASTPRAIFDSERWGPNPNPEMQWDFPVPAGAQVQVRLYFANRYSGTSNVGDRVFNVALDGSTVLSNYDIVADVGDQTGTMKPFDVTTPADGHIHIDFTHIKENPLVDGIEIVRTDLPPPGPSNVDDVLARTYDGAAAVGPTTTVASAGTLWSQARGAFMINGTLYYGLADGSLNSRTFNGTTFGPASVIDPYNDPIWSDVQTGSGQTYRGTMTDFSSQIPNVTGMFFAGGRIYYTLFNDNTLHSRPFSPDSGIIGGERQADVDSSVSWSDSSGMFVANGGLYWATRSDGNLHRMGFVANRPVAGTDTVLSGPSIDGNDWRTRALFLLAQ